MGYVLTSAPLTPWPLPSDYNVRPEIRPPLSRAVAVGKERRIWCFVGGISEQDINRKTPTKLALVGFLSCHVAFKVKCIAEECRGTEKVLCWSLQAKLPLALQIEGCIQFGTHGVHRCFRDKEPIFPGPAREQSERRSTGNTESCTVQREDDVSYTYVNATVTYMMCFFF